MKTVGDSCGACAYNRRRAGKSSRKPRRPRPYRRHCGECNAAHAASTTICAQAASTGTEGDHDAACRVVYVGATDTHISTNCRAFYRVLGRGAYHCRGFTARCCMRFITTRHAASLRTSSIGRIGFNPPHSKGRPRQKARMGSIFMGAFPFLRVNRIQSSNPISRRT